MNISWYESASVIQSSDGKGGVLQWPIIHAVFDCEEIANSAPELEMTPEEVAKIVDNLLEATEEMFDEYLAEWLEEVRCGRD